VELLVIPESQPRWLEFADDRLDRIETEKEIWERAMTDDARLKPDLEARGIRVQREPMANIAYTGFNMEDPVIGAPAGENGKKVRQAMCLAQDVDLWIKVMRNGHCAVPAYGPVPPNVYGYVDVPNPYGRRDVARAKRLLAEAGYPDGRGLPALHYEMYGSSTVTRNGAEIFKNSLKEIGIDVELIGNTGDQFITKLNSKNAQIFGLSYSLDYPDAQDFLQLFYGPYEAPNSNSSNYKNPEYDALYKRMCVMQPGPERDVIIGKMIALVNDDCPWSYTDLRTQYSFCQPWLRNFKYSDINLWMFKYCRVDRAEKARRTGGAEPQR
jgi:ABC-type transport system substrate-binding protein